MKKETGFFQTISRKELDTFREQELALVYAGQENGNAGGFYAYGDYMYSDYMYSDYTYSDYMYSDYMYSESGTGTDTSPGGRHYEDSNSYYGDYYSDYYSDSTSDLYHSSGGSHRGGGNRNAYVPKKAVRPIYVMFLWVVPVLALHWFMPMFLQSRGFNYRDMGSEMYTLFLYRHFLINGAAVLAVFWITCLRSAFLYGSKAGEAVGTAFLKLIIPAVIYIVLVLFLGRTLNSEVRYYALFAVQNLILIVILFFMILVDNSRARALKKSMNK